MEYNGYTITPEWKMIQAAGLGGQPIYVYLNPNDPTQNFASKSRSEGIDEFLSQGGRQFEAKATDYPQLLEPSSRLGQYNFTNALNLEGSQIINGERVATQNTSPTLPGSYEGSVSGTSGTSGGTSDNRFYDQSGTPGGGDFSIFTLDPKIKEMIGQLPPEMQGLALQLSRQLEKMVEAGKVLNPDIELTPQRLQEFMAQASLELDPYYKELMGQHKQDIETSLGRLSEDYHRKTREAEEPFKEGLARQAEGEAQAGLTYGSERIKREQQAVQEQQRNLDDVFRGVERGVQDTVKEGERTLGSNYLSTLQAPQFSQFTASTQGFDESQPRTVYNLEGNMLGDIPKQQITDESTRSSEIEDVFRRNRLLDLSSLS